MHGTFQIIVWERWLCFLESLPPRGRREPISRDPLEFCLENTATGVRAQKRFPSMANERAAASGKPFDNEEEALLITVLARVAKLSRIPDARTVVRVSEISFLCPAIPFPPFSRSIIL